jgi:hypothetical protein
MRWVRLQDIELISADWTDEDEQRNRASQTSSSSTSRQQKEEEEEEDDRLFESHVNRRARLDTLTNDDSGSYNELD